MLLALSMELVKSKAKDAWHCKSTRHDKSNASTLAIVGSIVAPEITNSVKELDAFKKRKNLDV